jgi:hypothetical protein
MLAPRDADRAHPLRTAAGAEVFDYLHRFEEEQTAVTYPAR